MLVVAGADHVITMDLHASQIQVRYFFLNKLFKKIRRKICDEEKKKKKRKNYIYSN